MSYAVSMLIVAAAGLAGGLLSLFLQARIKLAQRKAHQEYGTVVFLQLGVVFAVLLAFVFDSCWEGYNAAGQSIDFECGALHGAAMIAVALPDEQARTVLSLETRYVRSVIDAEWPRMRRDRRESLRTDDDLAALVRAVATLQVQGTEFEGDRDEIQRLVETAHAQREARIFQADQGVPGALWTVLIAFTIVLVGFVSLAALEQRTIAVAFTATFAAATTSILVLAHLLDYPFEGGLALEPTDFHSVLEKLQLLLRGVGG